MIAIKAIILFILIITDNEKNNIDNTPNLILFVSSNFIIKLIPIIAKANEK